MTFIMYVMLDIEFMFACNTGSLISMEMVWNPTASHAWSNCIGRLNLKTATELIARVNLYPQPMQY